MENQIEVLKQAELCGRQFTVYGSPEEPLFFAKDVAEIIEYSSGNASKLVNLVDDDEKVRNIITTLGGNQEVWFLTEDGLYEVLMQSRKPVAREFKKGVKTILKEVRAKGGYIAEKSDDTPEEIMARALTIAQETLNRREHRIAELQVQTEQQEHTIHAQEGELQKAAPKVNYYDQTLLSVNTLTTTQVAKSIGMEAADLNRKLKECGLIYRQSGMWMLHAPYSAWGLTATRTHTFTRSDGQISTNSYTVWTEKGRRLVTALHENDFSITRAVKSIKSVVRTDDTPVVIQSDTAMTAGKEAAV